MRERFWLCSRNLEGHVAVLILSFCCCWFLPRYTDEAVGGSPSRAKFHGPWDEHFANPVVGLKAPRFELQHSPINKENEIIPIIHLFICCTSLHDQGCIATTKYICILSHKLLSNSWFLFLVHGLMLLKTSCPAKSLVPQHPICLRNGSNFSFY